MARRLRLKLLGDGWRAFGGLAVPDDGVIEVREQKAAAFLRDRSNARKVEVLGWVDDQRNAAEPEAPLPE